MVNTSVDASTSSEIELLEGGLFKRTIFETLSANGDTADFILQNPTSSGVVAKLSTVGVAAEGKGYLESFKNPTVTAIGTTLTPVNMRFDKSDGSQSNLAHGGTYTGGTTLGQELLAAGQKGTAPTTTAFGNTLLYPGNAIRFLLTNEAGGNSDYAFTFEWLERRSGLFPPQV